MTLLQVPAWPLLRPTHHAKSGEPAVVVDDQWKGDCNPENGWPAGNAVPL